MDAIELAKHAIQEAFYRALHSDSEDAFDRRDTVLAASLRRVIEHLGDPATLSQAANAPLSPFSPCSPLALACHLFAGARGADCLSAPESCKALLEMGADAFAPSPAPLESPHLPGRYIFASTNLNAFEIALAKNDGGLILSMAPLASSSDFQPQHWSAYKLFCDFRDPLRSRCDEVLSALAERGFLMSCLDAAPVDSPSKTSGSGKRL